MPIPLTILTGFLGAGKTTLLNRILHAPHGQRIAVLVNDFGAVNIDAQLVVDVRDSGATISLSNGCVCCTIQGDLVEAILRLVNGAEPPEYIVLETSGVSDPLEVVLLLRTMAEIRIDSVLTVVDAEQFLEATANYRALAMNQVALADILLLNKLDLATPEQLARIRAYVREIAPRARVLETVHAEAPLELLLGVGVFDVQQLAERQPLAAHVHEGEAHDHEHPDHSLIFSTWHWQSAKPVSTQALRNLIETLPLTIYRAKGIFFAADEPDYRGVLQVVGQRARLTFEEKWGTATPQSQFVAIASHDGFEAADMQQRLEACLAENAPKTELERIANSALDWLRHRRPKTTKFQEE